MRSRIYSFESEKVIVHWDSHRCIHVEACVRALPHVFSPSERPWIHPERADAVEIARACEACPAGALHYARKDGGPAEATPSKNTITIASDGPLYVSGDVRVADGEGKTLLEETRVALCRCGRTRNRPLCDGSHERAGFRAHGALTEAHLATSESEPAEQGKLVLRAADPGPLTIDGSAEIRGDTSDDCCVVRIGALCCCGKSKNMPFCDGSHARD